MGEDKGIPPIDVASLQHSEDLLKVEDIMIEECEAKDMIGFRMKLSRHSEISHSNGISV